MFIDYEEVKSCSWQAFERMVSRALVVSGYSDARIVGQSGDHGADVIANKNGMRWLFQVKHWEQPVGIAVIDETIKAASTYEAKVPVIVASNGFDSKARDYQKVLMRNEVPIQMWDVQFLMSFLNRNKDKVPNKYPPREYQERAIQGIVNAFINEQHRAMVVLATGLGKTFVAAEALRRIGKIRPIRVLVLAHTNPLVYQLERSFWKFMTKEQRSIVWNGMEMPYEWQLSQYEYVFACIDSVESYINSERILPDFDVVLIDECHHAGSNTYRKVLDEVGAGKENGAFLIGLTATPWRPDEVQLESIFGDPVVSIDMIEGLKKGFLSNVDYRMYTDNINWEALKNLDGKTFTPKQINRTLFIDEWDDSVVYELKKTWGEQDNPRAIVFCGTIDHAKIMCQKLNALGFCNARAIYSGNAGSGMSQYEKNRVLSDFSDGHVDVVCTVDIFNEGLDVPDVNILVFQRVTHSRRIFIQQLGRGLRIADNKDKVIVLDFVSDVRRFAAGIELKDGIETGAKDRKPTRVKLNNNVTFKKVTGDDPETEQFLRIWLDDVAAIETAGENSSVLKFPPEFKNSRHN